MASIHQTTMRGEKQILPEIYDKHIKVKGRDLIILTYAFGVKIDTTAIRGVDSDIMGKSIDFQIFLFVNLKYIK